MNRLLITLLCLALFILTACNAPVLPPAPATPTLVVTKAVPTPTPIVISVVDQEMLGGEQFTAVCDAPPEATFVCTDATTFPHMEVGINASTFARWRIHWENATPLTGNETLAMNLTVSGKVAPNLYLVSQDGSRVGIPMSQFGALREGSYALHIPLLEVIDRQGNSPGNSPDHSQVNGIEIVFEWSDMQGAFALDSLRLESVWREAVAVDDEAVALAATLQVPEGFAVRAIAQDLQQNTQIGFTSAGDMLVSLQNGRVWRYRDLNGDGVYDERNLYTVGSLDLVGLLYDSSDGGVWLGSRGQLMHTLDSDGDGVADTRTIRFEGIPWGRHQNNGMVWNPDPDPFTGEAGGTWLYFGFGSIDDLDVGDPLNATVLRFPRTGQSAAELEVVSEGNRNAYDVLWVHLPVDPSQPAGSPDNERAWQLFASENGPDFNDAPDEVNHIRWGHHFGFPDQFGPLEDDELEGNPFSGPVYPVTPHASADGLAYIDNPTWPAEYRTLYLSLFGEVFNPIPVGHIVERITLRAVTLPNGELTYRGEPSTFINGLDRPLPLATSPDGNMLVGDYATGVIYKILYVDE